MVPFAEWDYHIVLKSLDSPLQHSPTYFEFGLIADLTYF